MTVAPEQENMEPLELSNSTCDFCQEKAVWVRKQSCGCWITLCNLHEEAFWANTRCIVCRQIFDQTLTKVEKL